MCRRDDSCIAATKAFPIKDLVPLNVVAVCRKYKVASSFFPIHPVFLFLGHAVLGVAVAPDAEFSSGPARNPAGGRQRLKEFGVWPIDWRPGSHDAGWRFSTREMTKMKNFFARLVRDEQGQDLIEYALLATFVSLVAIAGASLLGTALNNWYDSVSDRVDTAASSAAS